MHAFTLPVDEAACVPIPGYTTAEAEVTISIECLHDSSLRFSSHCVISMCAVRARIMIRNVTQRPVDDTHNESGQFAPRYHSRSERIHDFRSVLIPWHECTYYYSLLLPILALIVHKTSSNRRGSAHVVHG